MFGEVGPIDYLKQRFELTAADIVKKVEKVIGRKPQAKPKTPRKRAAKAAVSSNSAHWVTHPSGEAGGWVS